MKTALEELIERFSNFHNMKRNNVIHLILHYDQLTELLEKEREQIEEAYEDALIKMGTATNERQYAEQYFNERYKQ